jgi:hypothetical protein
LAVEVKLPPNLTVFVTEPSWEVSLKHKPLKPPLSSYSHISSELHVAAESWLCSLHQQETWAFLGSDTWCTFCPLLPAAPPLPPRELGKGFLETSQEQCWLSTVP